MSSPSLATIQIQMNFYGSLVLLVAGTIGNLLVLILFSRRLHNACSLYLINSAATNIFYLQFSIFFRIFPPNYNEQSMRALIICKIVAYVPNAFGQITKTMLLFACIDRYMITSNQAHLRAFSTAKRAKYLILFCYIFWLIVSCHVPIMTTIVYGRCTRVDPYATIYTLYIVFVVGLIPSVTLIAFAYLTYRNVRRLRRQIQPTAPDGSAANGSIQRRDRELLVLVLSEVIIYVSATFWFPAVLLEMMISQYIMPTKSLQYFRAEMFAFNVTILLLNTYSAAPFYTYVISSASFRREFQQLIVHWYRKAERRAPDQNRLQTNRTLTQRETRV